MIESTKQSAAIARRLVAVVSRTSSSGLSGEYRSLVELLPPGSCVLPAGEDERMELLNAVVRAMQRSAERSARRMTPVPEGREVHLRLLRHLAAPPATEAV